MLNAGSTVLTLSLTRPVWVRAYIDEPNLGQMQPGRELLLYTDGRPDKPYHGKVGLFRPPLNSRQNGGNAGSAYRRCIACASSSPMRTTRCAACQSP